MYDQVNFFQSPQTFSRHMDGNELLQVFSECLVRKIAKYGQSSNLNVILFLFCRIGIVPVPDKEGWTEQNRVKYAKKNASRLQQNAEHLGIMIIYHLTIWKKSYLL